MWSWSLPLKDQMSVCVIVDGMCCPVSEWSRYHVMEKGHKWAFVMNALEKQPVCERVLKFIARRVLFHAFIALGGGFQLLFSTACSAGGDARLRTL